MYVCVCVWCVLVSEIVVDLSKNTRIHLPNRDGFPSDIQRPSDRFSSVPWLCLNGGRSFVVHSRSRCHIWMNIDEHEIESDQIHRDASALKCGDQMINCDEEPHPHITIYSSLPCFSNIWIFYIVLRWHKIVFIVWCNVLPHWLAHRPLRCDTPPSLNLIWSLPASGSHVPLLAAYTQPSSRRCFWSWDAAVNRQNDVYYYVLKSCLPGDYNWSRVVLLICGTFNQLVFLGGICWVDIRLESSSIRTCPRNTIPKKCQEHSGPLLWKIHEKIPMFAGGKSSICHGIMATARGMARRARTLAAAAARYKPSFPHDHGGFPMEHDLLSWIVHIWVSINGGSPIWMVFVRENPVKLDDLGVPLFQETTISMISNESNESNVYRKGSSPRNQPNLRVTTWLCIVPSGNAQ